MTIYKLKVSVKTPPIFDTIKPRETQKKNTKTYIFYFYVPIGGGGSEGSAKITFFTPSLPA